MTSENIIHHTLENPAPTNNTDPIGGKLGAAWTSGSTLFNLTPSSDEEDLEYYGAGAVKIDDGAEGYLDNPGLYLKTGAKPNASAGQVTVEAESALDAGQAYILGYVSGELESELIPVSTTPNTGSKTFDLEGVLLYEYRIGDNPAKPNQNITFSVEEEVTAVVFGTRNGQDLPGATSQANTLAMLAPASALNTEIGWSGDNNRLTAPDQNVEAFEAATRWEGEDESIVVPDMFPGDELQFAAKLLVPQNWPSNLLINVQVALHGLPGSGS